MPITGDTLEGAIAATVAYFDVFAFAPRPAEVHRFLIGRSASRGEVEAALEGGRLWPLLGTREGTWFLAGKDHLAPRRRRFEHHSAALWPAARAIARTIERTGLATSGMVTGSLAADNADEHADIDFLFTVPAGRTWTSFAALRLLGRVPKLGLGMMCANYVLVDDALEVRPQNLFTAFEIAKAVPMFGFGTYRALVHANRWVTRFLPNALPHLDGLPEDPPLRTEPALLRTVTRLPAFRALEEAERRRKFAAERRDVGVDMAARIAGGSMDRHAPTRSFHALSELRYRLEQLGLEAHPLFGELSEATRWLGAEMGRWGKETIGAPRGPELDAGEEQPRSVRATG